MERKNAWEKYDESGKKDVFEFSEKFLFFGFFLIFYGQQKLYLHLPSASCPVHNRNNESICPLQKCMI